MKRYEVMSKEDIIKATTPKYCGECKCDACCNSNIGSAWCRDAIVAWLNEEVVLKPRFETIKTAEQLEEARQEFKARPCKFECEKCDTVDFFVDFLKEEVEVK